MKFTIPNKSLKEALDRLGNIPGAKGSIPHTQAVRFSADMSGLKLTRFTNEAKIVVMVDDAEIEDEEGDFTVDHSSIFSRVNRFPGKMLVLETDEKNVTLSSASAKGKVALFSEESELDPPESDEGESASLPVEHLIKLLSDVAPAMHADDSEATFKGINFCMMGDRMALIATDKRRCHVALYDLNIHGQGIVASEGVQAILRALAGQQGACAISIGEAKIGIFTSNIEITMSLVNEKYPDLARYIEKYEASKVFKVAVSREELNAGLRSCMDLGEDDSKLVSVEVGKKSLKISANDRRTSEQEIEMPCEASGEFTIGVPSTQLIDAMGMMELDENGKIEIHTVDEGRVILIRQANRIASLALKSPNKK